MNDPVETFEAFCSNFLAHFKRADNDVTAVDYAIATQRAISQNNLRDKRQLNGGYVYENTFDGFHYAFQPSPITLTIISIVFLTVIAVGLICIL